MMYCADVPPQALGAILTSFGAEVIKINSPHLPDPNALQLTLTAGKHTGSADLNVSADRERVLRLIEDADVVVQGFRKGGLERKGFGLEDILTIANKRGRGIVYLDLSCYGPDGTYAERPGTKHCVICENMSLTTCRLPTDCGCCVWCCICLWQSLRLSRGHKRPTVSTDL
jgi:crotonobetainyl-CoA:carnitine CoA-transferase CaiB-like acyl-CoA transferase